MHEPLLDVPLVNGPQKAQPRKLLKLENGQSVIHRYLPNASFREDGLRKDLRNPVEGEGDDPVEHFHQEREFLHNPAVEVVRKPRRIRCVEYCSAASSLFRRIFHRGQGFCAHVVVAFVGQHLISCQEIVGRSG